MKTTARPGSRHGRQRPARYGRRVETWLWTGPLGHLLGGALDFGQALARYLLARARGRAVR
jgi:hypothetical protein